MRPVAWAGVSVAGAVPRCARRETDTAMTANEDKVIQARKVRGIVSTLLRDRIRCGERPVTSSGRSCDRLIALALLSALALATPAWAHPTPFSYVDVRLQQQGSVEITISAHIVDVAHEFG